jgi:hypothetical protein
MRSLPELESAITNQPKKEAVEKLKMGDELESISKRTRSKEMLR